MSLDILPQIHETLAIELHKKVVCGITTHAGVRGKMLDSVLMLRADENQEYVEAINLRLPPVPI